MTTLKEDMRKKMDEIIWTEEKDNKKEEKKVTKTQTENNVKDVENNAKVVDENGAEITALNGLAKGTKFYIRIPADQVSSDTKTLTVEVVGHFDSVVGNYYIADGLQKVVTASNTVVVINASDSIDVVGAPNTGMSTAQTIYFIGLIVLLCGVGIVYANAKPAESK